MQPNLPHFLSFAPLYQAALPLFPFEFKEVVQAYLDGPPTIVADLGCGKGDSTLAWADFAVKAIGIDPCGQDITSAKQRSSNDPSVEFLCSPLSSTYLGDNSTDVVLCPHSKFYCGPEQIEKEICRILRPGGIFILYDFTFPPLCGFAVEKAYARLKKIITAIQNTFSPPASNIPPAENFSFSFSRKASFCSWESCDADRFLTLALGHKNITTLLKKAPELMLLHLDEFEQETRSLLPHPITAGFCFDSTIYIK